jgi:hypothetical protein
MVFVAEGAPFAKALDAVMEDDIELLIARDPIPGRESVTFDEIACHRGGGGSRGRQPRGEPRHGRQIPLHLRLDGHAERRSSTRTAC